MAIVNGFLDTSCSRTDVHIICEIEHESKNGSMNLN
jgi:hypothetical protein